ncbi:hypothetical protein WA026_015817, partial [Henosepilachna vigintioctopunctata]
IKMGTTKLFFHNEGKWPILTDALNKSVIRATSVQTHLFNNKFGTPSTHTDTFGLIPSIISNISSTENWHEAMFTVLSNSNFGGIMTSPLYTLEKYSAKRPTISSPSELDLPSNSMQLGSAESCRLELTYFQKLCGLECILDLISFK